MGTKRNTAPERDGDKARQAANEYLRPVIEGTRGYGSRARLAQMVTEELGTPIDRHLLKRMLNEDEEKRQQPHLGIALVVRRVFDANKKKLCQPAKLPYWSRRGKAETGNGSETPTKPPAQKTKTKK